jgi:predicted  nucleic acid-binding Zn-ribbon protein
MSKEIKELKEEIKALKQRISGLEHDLDYQIQQNSTNGKLSKDIKQLQEAVASMANQPVGIMFDYRA